MRLSRVLHPLASTSGHNPDRAARRHVRRHGRGGIGGIARTPRRQHHGSTIGEIDAAFATLERERPDALFVAGDAFFVSRAVQFATLAARDRIPATYALRDYVAAGGLMSYATDFTDSFHQVGVYTGTILKGVKPADLPVLQSTKFEFVINLQIARSLGIAVPDKLIAIADEVIE
jgi:putative ABC transport system substrate-binding protein